MADRLCNILENDLILSSVVEGGGTQRDHIKIRNPNDERLKPIVIGIYEQYIFEVFNQLCFDRPQGMSGVAGIPLSAFINYQTLFNDVLNIDEIQVLQQLDSQFRTTLTELKG